MLASFAEERAMLASLTKERSLLALLAEDRGHDCSLRSQKRERESNARFARRERE